MSFGEKLQKLRRNRGWTQEELAGKIGISRQALSKWEQGTAVPDTENVLRLSALFQVSTDYLLKDNWTEEPGQNHQKTSHAGKIRVIAGICAAVLALLGMLILGILSSVFPAAYAVSPAGEEWTRVYTGLFGFLKVYHLEWLFGLCFLIVIAGVIAIWYPRFLKLAAGMKAKFHRRKGNPETDGE